ncbi:response regulator [Cognaticolwellia mytili]|uniref:response regulator n=1 Tax=Cognaticolwellia mytili TaxID=1888913 RepID=UPI000A176E2E|nr:response regulator [Cognaticolwellia mytili]
MSEAYYLLYVEDNEGDVELLQMCIERYCPAQDIILDVAETIEEGKKSFKFDKHIAALIDWNLPDGEGTEMVEFIQAKAINIPIFLLSGVFTPRHLRIAEEFNFTTCIEKDYNKHFIEQILQKLNLNIIRD